MYFKPSNPYSDVKEWAQFDLMLPTCQVLDDRCHVDRRPHADAVFVRASAQVPHHPPHREDDARPGGAGQLGGLLLSASGWHLVLDTGSTTPMSD